VERVELLRDVDRPSGWLLLVDGVPQSYVDPTDPAYLDFDYVRAIAGLVDLALPRPRPLSAVHVGGGGLTLPRWLAATRPGSIQLVLEPDTEVTAEVRRVLPLPRRSGIRVRGQGGREALASRPDASADLVVLDAFEEGRVPFELTTTEYVREVARVLRPGGTYVVNLADAPPLTFARRAVRTVREVFAGEITVLAHASVVRRRRHGNVVIAAGAPVDSAVLGRSLRSDPFALTPVADVDRFVGGLPPLRDGDPPPAQGGPVDGWRIPRM